MKYVQRLHDMDESRLCKLAYLSECRNGLGWWKGVDLWCTALGIQPPFPGTEFSSSSAADIDQRAAVIELMTAKAGSRKEQAYFSFKTVFQMEGYVSEAKNKHLRRLSAKFRTGSHWLRVQTGRYKSSRVEYHERVCTTCSQA